MIIFLIFEQWLMFHNNAEHQGKSGAIGPVSSELLFKYELGSISSSSPVVYNDFVYVGSNSGALVAIKNGEEVWEFKTGGFITTSPAVDDNGNLYVGSYDGKLYSLTNSGKKRWEFDAGSEIASSPTVYKDKVYFAADSILYALSTNTGEEVFRYVTNGKIKSSPAIKDNFIGFGTWWPGPHQIYIITISGGNMQKKIISNGCVSSACWTNDTMFITTKEGKLYAFKSSGVLLWGFSIGAAISSSPAVDGNGVYFGASDSSLYAVSKEGQVRWKYKTNGIIESSPAVDKDGNIFFGSTDSMFYALDKEGHFKWFYKTQNRIVSSPAIGAHGTVYFTSWDGCLYAIGPGAAITEEEDIVNFIFIEGDVFNAPLDGDLFSVDGRALLHIKRGKNLLNSLSKGKYVFRSSNKNAYYLIKE